MNKRYHKIISGVLLTLCFVLVNTHDSFSLNYGTTSNSFTGGGGSSTSFGYKSSGTIGQLAAGTGSSLTYMAQAGFWNPSTSFVASINHSPNITGFPDTKASVGTFYSFPPFASDPDGNTLTFSITGQPTWASFNSVTGRLSGTPLSSGTYGNIQISVSDGFVTVPLAPFDIVVAASEAAPVTTGNTVKVEPSSGVTVTFNSVTSGGSVSVVQNPSPPPPPSNFQVVAGNNYLLETTAIYSGSIVVCLDYNDLAVADSSESLLRLLHYNGSVWQDVTTSVDTTSKLICGSVTSMSPFIVAQPLSGSGTQVPVMDGIWLLPGVLAGLGLFARRRKE